MADEGHSAEIKDMKRTEIIIGILVVIFIAYRPVVKWFSMPSVTRADWVESLATLGIGAARANELPPWDGHSQENQRDYSAIVKANDQKRHLMEVFNSGKGHYGLLQRYSTVEGQPIYSWLIVEDGKMKFIEDCTRDGGAPPTAIHVSTPKSVRVGFYRNGKFIESTPSSQDSPVRIIQLDIGKYDLVKFY